MRITIVLPVSDLSGGNRVVSIYAERLGKRGHTVTVVSRPQRIPTRIEQLKAVLKRRPFPRRVAFGQSHIDRVAGITYKRIDSVRPIVADDLPDADVVIATWWETAEWVNALPKSKGAKVFFVQHFEVHPPQPVARVEAVWRLPMQKIVIAQWLGTLAAQRFGDPTSILVPNAVDAEQFFAPPRGKQPIPTVGMMYAQTPFKGCAHSIKAVNLARKKVDNLRMIAFGNQAATMQLSLPLNTDYFIRPAQDKIRDIYAKADVWLVGSRSEGFGLPILEAMACRTPVIGTPTGAAPELLTPGGGQLVPMDSIQAMADAIVRIVTQPEPAWKTMSDIAYATATKYTWDDATQAFEIALEQVIDKS